MALFYSKRDFTQKTPKKIHLAPNELVSSQQNSQEGHETLFEKLYHELQIISRSKMRGEGGTPTLQPTALVNEAYLKLASSKQKRQWNDRKHFLRTMAEVMRQILIDSARARASQKRGGEFTRVDFDENQPVEWTPHHDTLALHEALNKYEKIHPVKAELVQLRYFTGLTVSEAADLLEISKGTAQNYWNYSKAWLQRELNDSQISE